MGDFQKNYLTPDFGRLALVILAVFLTEKDAIGRNIVPETLCKVAPYNELEFCKKNFPSSTPTPTKPVANKPIPTKPVAGEQATTVSTDLKKNPSAAPEVKPEGANGTKFQSSDNNWEKTDFANTSEAQPQKNESYSAEEIRAFTAAGGFRNLEGPVEEAPPLQQELNSQAPQKKSNAGDKVSLSTSERNEVEQERGTLIEKPMSRSAKLDSLLLSDDPWVAQMARTTLPAVINQIKGSSEMRESLRERLAALLAKRPNLTEQEEKMATMMEVALAEAESEDPNTKALADLKSLNIQETFKLDPEETRSGIYRLIAELEYDAEFLPKQSLFERISTAHRKMQSQKRL